ncbi:unnamed protein product [Mytilus coruscus]|uniref:Uncharacterized protein n=1 Tax=Mytilus coruscus TaxID=42192 RepID=A0A6J8CNT5_MYTCO|nr:unnamed protein product [Mytilus coruscus]
MKTIRFTEETSNKTISPNPVQNFELDKVVGEQVDKDQKKKKREITKAEKRKENKARKEEKVVKEHFKTIDKMMKRYTQDGKIQWEKEHPEKTGKEIRERREKKRNRKTVSNNMNTIKTILATVLLSTCIAKSLNLDMHGNCNAVTMTNNIHVQLTSEAPDRSWSVTLSSQAPHKIYGTETWFSNVISPYEYISPSKYTVYNKDRKDGYEGVLLAVSNKYISSQVNEFDTDCEIIWANMTSPNNKTLYLSAYYRPPSDKG